VQSAGHHGSKDYLEPSGDLVIASGKRSGGYMRIKATIIVASAVTMCAFNSAWSQALIPQSKVKAQEAAAAAQAATPAPSAVQAAPAPAAGTTTATATAPTPTQLKTNCSNPNAIGVSRVVSIDTTGGPGFGFEHFKQLDFLRDKEVVLTFDDGPWPVNTPSVLKTLDEECTKAIFFPIGKHSTYYPEILKQVAEKGHTIGAHTWSHANLNNKKMTEEMQKDEIERGFSAVKWALGADPAPFFRAPALQHPPAMVTYLGTRNIAIWSCDLDSFDFKASKPETVVKSVMTKLDKMGKGIILMHDFQKHTAEALPELMKQLKAGGYKVVQVKAKAPVQTIAQYDEEVIKGLNLPTISSRPVSSVVETISEVK
jgi:peptidoglycan/xylan/chitin deacetylase (PgdA/CDA1 family)